MSSVAPLQRTPLFSNHIAANGRMVPFAGWEMPVQYEGVLSETKAVRTNVGMFDVSHMGRLYIEGTGSGEFLEHVLTFAVTNLNPGRARYGFVLTEEGGVIDDTVVYQQSPEDGSGERYLMICNAANRPAIVDWLNEHMGDYPGVTMTDFTTESVMIAVQGPAAAAIADSLCDSLTLSPPSSVEELEANAAFTIDEALSAVNLCGGDTAGCASEILSQLLP